MDGVTETEHVGRALESSARLHDLGRKWHVVIGVDNRTGDWYLRLVDPAKGRGREPLYLGPDLDKLIAAAWAGAPDGPIA